MGNLGRVDERQRLEKLDDRDLIVDLQRPSVEQLPALSNVLDQLFLLVETELHLRPITHPDDCVAGLEKAVERPTSIVARRLDPLERAATITGSKDDNRKRPCSVRLTQTDGHI